ncbi:hypothetical protein VNO78_12136 [Psophocarpus tetragonolobus]|uniref:Uncharacterized protein n=1 Tax=Psophocarpus tetragonolobus TaxID=3891 RepID=A0AAN9SMH2_PSOTE
MGENLQVVLVRDIYKIVLPALLSPSFACEIQIICQKGEQHVAKPVCGNKQYNPPLPSLFSLPSSSLFFSSSFQFHKSQPFSSLLSLTSQFNEHPKPNTHVLATCPLKLPSFFFFFPHKSTSPKASTLFKTLFKV